MRPIVPCRAALCERLAPLCGELLCPILPGNGVAVLNCAMSRIEELEVILDAELVELGHECLRSHVQVELIPFPRIDVDAAHGAEGIGVFRRHANRVEREPAL